MELGAWDLRLQVRNQTFETAFLKQLSYPGFTYFEPEGCSSLLRWGPRCHSAPNIVWQQQSKPEP